MSNKIVVSLISFLGVLSSFGVNADTAYGRCNYGKETIYSISCFGPTKLTETTVSGTVSIAGPFDAERSKIDSMQIAGVANMKNSTVTGDTVISGVLNAKHANFDGAINIASNKALMNNSTVKGSITMLSKEKTPVLELYCGTKIMGDINFKAKAGIIKKSADSIIRGKVINGTIVAPTENIKCD